MNYTNLIAPNNDFTYFELLEGFLFKKDGFIHFHPFTEAPLTWFRRSQQVNTNWKARISIHPEDMDKAWEIISARLYKNKMSFKVVNGNFIAQFKYNRLNRLTALMDEYHQFLHAATSQDIKSLRQTYYQIYQQLDSFSYSSSPYLAFFQMHLTTLIAFFKQVNLNQADLFACTQNMYERLIVLRQQKVKNSSRFDEGMQFTIYISPGFEQNCQNILEEIEHGLINAGIRAGTVFATDRQIGVYSSIRHPGKCTYYSATDVSLESYNPDNIDDPFGFLETLSTNDILQDDEIQMIDEHNAKFILDLLKTKKFISPSILKALAVYKENMMEYIKKSPIEERRELITDSLDKSTNLGVFFRVQRGRLATKLTRGTLKQIKDEQLALNCNQLSEPRP